MTTVIISATLILTVIFFIFVAKLTTPSAQQFEKYWKENPERITVRFADDDKVRCTVFKDATPWFVMFCRGGFGSYHLNEPNYYKGPIYDVRKLATALPCVTDSTGFNCRYVADTYLHITAISSLPKADQPIDPLLKKAYQEIDGYVKQSSL